MRLIELFEQSSDQHFLINLYNAVSAYTDNDHTSDAGTAGRAFLKQVLHDSKHKRLTYTGSMVRMMKFEGPAPDLSTVIAKGKGQIFSFSKTMEGLEDFLEKSGDIGDYGPDGYITDVYYQQNGIGIDVATVYDIFKQMSPDNLKTLNIHPQLFTLERAARAEEVIAPLNQTLKEVSEDVHHDPYGDEDDDY